MKAKILALLSVALIAAMSPAMISLVAGASPAAAHAHHPILFTFSPKPVALTAESLTELLRKKGYEYGRDRP